MAKCIKCGTEIEYDSLFKQKDCGCLFCEDCEPECSCWIEDKELKDTEDYLNHWLDRER